MNCEGEELIEVMKLLYQRGLITVLSGNASLKCGEFFLITPSGVPKHKIKDLTRVNLKTLEWEGPKPSIEYRMHAQIYLNTDFQSVVHAHNPLTVALADVYAEDQFNELVSKYVETRYAISKVGVVERIDAGSLELAEAVGRKFSEGSDVVVMKGHGVIAGGRNPFDALNKVEAMEYLALVETARCGTSVRRQEVVYY
ncbi:aldolase [Ignicoccus islandicus DSM 13165]|uniref:Aldolase n=1 Tax=Ignicoccus islandicus DSM 13165 TaxID=940295 RepID=A0A0U2M9V0_9CREN|nr:class II aldolase/adducin family protein [Ignicoccus islandicus]ALU11853.1 aldolase [Ignicoccus islandicus DSM 13165]